MSDLFQPDHALHPSKLSPGLYTALMPSGLRVIIKEDHRSPVAICNVWVRVGSNKEPEALRGWSHGIEHMLFKGTKKRNEGDFAREVAEAGGSTNAGTGYETTNYHITLPAENLNVAMDILGDSLFHSTFDAESLDAERQVLVHENHMYDDIPFGFGITWRWGMELAFDTSPYRFPIGGMDENLLQRKREDILAFWRSAYRPDNATVVICGDINHEEVFALIQAKFPTKKSDWVEPPTDASVSIVPEPEKEKTHAAPRLRIEYGDIQKAYAKIIFPTPGEGDDQPVLSVIRRALSDGRSSRLYRQIQERDELVDDFAVMGESCLREGLMIFDVETDVDRLPGALQGICRVLSELKTDSCTSEELERAQIRVLRAVLFAAETVQGQASQIGHYEALGDLPGAFEYSDRVKEVSRERVRTLCQDIFNINDLSCIIYLPKDCDLKSTKIPADAEGLEKLLGPSLQTGTPEAKLTPTRTVKPQASPSAGKPGSGAPLFTQATIAGGITVNYRVDHQVPVLTLAINNCGGATAETAANSGLSHLAQVVMVKSSGQMETEEIHALLEGDGASLSARTDRDFGGIFLSGLSANIDRPLELTGQLLSDPAFNPREIELEKRLCLEHLVSLSDNPFQFAALKLRGMIFGDHPYGRPLSGTETSIPTLGREALVALHRERWVKDNMEITVSGSFEPEQLLPKLEKMVAGIAQGDGQPLRPTPGLANVPQGIMEEKIVRTQKQSVVLVAWPGPKSTTEHRAPLMLLKEILNGQSGRLFESLRNRRSLCYNTGTLSTAGFGQGMFLGYVLTAPESELQARDALVEELAKICGTVIGSEELGRARAKLVGNMLLAGQSNASRVNHAAYDRIYGRDANDMEHLVAEIRQCTAEDIRMAAETYILPDGRFEVRMGP